MTRTYRKRTLKARLNAQLTRAATARHKGPQSASTLLADEAKRLHDLSATFPPKARALTARAAHAFHLAACWLNTRNDPANIRQWREIKHKKP
jgi:hypothetical protein